MGVRGMSGVRRVRRGEARHRITKALDSPASTGSGKQFNITFNGREKGIEGER